MTDARAIYRHHATEDEIAETWGPIDDVSIVIEPTRWRSWTGGLLHAAAVKELGSDYEGAWLDDE